MGLGRGMNRVKERVGRSYARERRRGEGLANYIKACVHTRRKKSSGG